MVNKKDYDVVIIGGGHNGLTAAGYLARAGLTVCVLERRNVVGGAALTEEFHPGYRCSILSFLTGMLEPKVVDDLELARFGFKILRRPAGPFLPSVEGPGLLMAGALDETVEMLKSYSPADAQPYRQFDAELMAVGAALRKVALRTPPNIGGGFADVVSALGTLNEVRRLEPNHRLALIDLFTKSIGDYLDSRFQSDALKAVQTFGAMSGVFLSPYAPNTAYGLLHHAWGMTSGVQGKFDYVRGGMGAITQAMAKSAESRGAEIRVSCSVREVIVEKGRANGVVLHDGTIVRARAVASNLNPRLLFGHLVDPGALPAAFRSRMTHWRCGSGSFRMTVALAELPDWRCRPGTQQQLHHTSSAFICPSLSYFQDAYLTASTLGWSTHPIIDMTVPSTLDDTLAPPGKHVATLFCQHFSPTLPDGRSWDQEKEKAADRVIDTVNQYAPNFRRSVIARKVISPLDLEREWGLIGGDIFHGSQNLDQIFSLRPAAGYADYRSPIHGLYLCGSGSHPGGGVTGAPGHNAAREMISDFRRRRL